VLNRPHPVVIPGCWTDLIPWVNRGVSPAPVVNRGVSPASVVYSRM